MYSMMMQQDDWTMAGQLWIVGHGRTVMDCWRWQAVMDCWTWQAAQPEMQMTLVGAAPHMRVGAADHDRPKTTTELGTERCQTLKLSWTVFWVLHGKLFGMYNEIRF